MDGVLDPVAWSTGAGNSARTQPVSTRLRSDAGARATLDEFFRLCDAAGPPGCAFAPRSAKRYAALAERLKDDPTPIKDPFTGEVFLYNYSFLVADTLGAMYFSPDWPFFAELLAYVDANVDPDGAGAALASFRDRLGVTDPTFDRYQNQIEGVPGRALLGLRQPGQLRRLERGGQRRRSAVPLLRAGLDVGLQPVRRMAGLQDAARYMGPFTANTQSPVLVVGTKFDPATRYEGARTVAGLLPNSRLLTVRAWGHTSGGLSVCADEVVTRYVVDGALPPPGTVCPQNVKPFTNPAGSRGGAEPARPRWPGCFAPSTFHWSGWYGRLSHANVGV